VSTFGSRRSYAVVTFLMLLPCLATGFALMDKTTSFGVFLLC
jgi:nitrate/nitrite transporter NarK